MNGTVMPFPQDRRESEPRHRRAGLLQTGRAVLWSFFGVRRKSDLEQDAAELNPVYVIAIGIVAAALLVMLLIVIVNLVVR